jgi:hypothetical protein
MDGRFTITADRLTLVAIYAPQIVDDFRIAPEITPKRPFCASWPVLINLAPHHNFLALMKNCDKRCIQPSKHLPRPMQHCTH